MISRVKTPSSSVYQSPISILIAGQHFVTAAPTLGIASLLGQQMIEQISGFPIRVVRHYPIPLTMLPLTSGPIVAVRWRAVLVAQRE